MKNVRVHASWLGLAGLVLGLSIGCRTLPTGGEKDPSPCAPLRFSGGDADAFAIACEALRALGIQQKTGSPEAGFAAGETGDSAHSGEIVGVYWRPGHSGLVLWVTSKPKMRANPFTRNWCVPVLKELRPRLAEYEAAHAQEPPAAPTPVPSPGLTPL